MVISSGSSGWERRNSSSCLVNSYPCRGNSSWVVRSAKQSTMKDISGKPWAGGPFVPVCAQRRTKKRKGNKVKHINCKSDLNFFMSLEILEHWKVKNSKPAHVEALIGQLRNPSLPGLPWFLKTAGLPCFAWYFSSWVPPLWLQWIAALGLEHPHSHAETKMRRLQGQHVEVGLQGEPASTQQRAGCPTKLSSMDGPDECTQHKQP